MPKIKASSTQHCCSRCSRSFKSSRALSLHQYHSTSCNYSDINPPIVDTASDEEFLPYNDEEDSPTYEQEELPSINVPFELTRADLKSLPGETDVVAHITEQRVHTELLHILDKAEAPDYLFKDIIEWASRANSMEYNFRPVLSSRNAVLNDLEQHFNTHNLRPAISQLKLESVNERVPIVSFDFKEMLVSLLTDTNLMKPENLVINNAITKEDGTLDVSPWFEPYCPTIPANLNEVLSGSWYRDTVVAIMNCPNVFVCPLIFYVDSTFIDPMKSRFNLEPLNFTLAIFNRNCRYLTKFWKTLGYVPESPKADDKKPSSGYKARNYHHMLEYLLQGLIAIHTNPSLLDNFKLRIGNHVKVVNLCIPIAFIISDTQGADRLCGRYVNYTEKIQRIHRSCLCHPSDAAQTTETCDFVDMDAMMDVVDRGDKEELRKYSQSYIPSHAFRYVNFGCNRHGIYFATPNDLLHGLKLGIIPYVLEIFFQDDLTPSSRHNLDQVLKDTLPYLKQGGNQRFPRVYFPNGLMTLSNMTAEECVGIMFVTLILCVTSQGRLAICQNEKMISIARLNIYIKVFEKLLTFLMWMSRTDGFWNLDDVVSSRRALRAIKSLMDFVTTNVPRNSGQGWNISKMHELLHVTRSIDLFGSPMNFDTGACERMHKDVAKKPGRAAQKRHSTFTLQAACRLSDRHVVDFAYQHFVPSSTQSKPTSSKGACAGSSFVLQITQNSEFSYSVTITGDGALASQEQLEQHLYPDLVRYTVGHFCQKYPTLVTSITCRSEYTDESGILYRAHHNYRSSGTWHDWAWVSFVNENNEEGFSNVPAKILCFLPNGVPGNANCHVVIHPCHFRSKKETSLITKWNLVSCVEASIMHIPYDIVPVSSLFGHCFVVPDLAEPGVVYEILDRQQWADKFL